MKNIVVTCFGFLLPFLLLGGLLWIDIQPDGMLKGGLVPGKRNPYMYHPLPDTRIAVKKDFQVGVEEDIDVYEMTGEPAYIALRLPKTQYDRVVMGVEFMPMQQTVFEIGPESSPGAQTFDLKPLYQEAIEKLKWTMRDVDGGFVYEKPGFEGKSHARDRIATYAYEPTTPYRDPAYAASTERRSYEVDLRGTHQMKVYIKDQPLDMQFTFSDMNREIGQDDLIVAVRDEEGRLVRELRQEDDGNERMDQEVNRFTIPLYLENLEEGVYEISISTTTDIFLRTIDTTLTRFVFMNRLYIGDAIGWRNAPARTDFYGNGQAYTLLTLHNEGLQTVYFDDASVMLNKTHVNTQFILEKPSERLRMRVPNGDVSVVSDGVFALTAEQFFMPDPVQVGPFTDIERLGVEAVYTSYTRLPDTNGAWRYAEQTFDAASWWSAGYGTVRFALSAPFIATQEGAMYIRRITVRFEKAPITTPRDFIRAVRERIPFGI